MSYRATPFVESYADLFYVPVTGTIKAGDPLMSLRILSVRHPEGTPADYPTHYFHLGHGNFHDARRIIEDIIIEDKGGPDALHFDPMPSPDPSPIALLDGTFTHPEVELLLGLLSGADKKFLAAQCGGPEVASDIMERFKAHGIEVLGASFTKVLADEVRAARATRFREHIESTAPWVPHSTTAATAPDTFKPSDPLGTITKPWTPTHDAMNNANTENPEGLETVDTLPVPTIPAGAMFSAITTVPPDMLEKLSKAKSTQPRRAKRIEWPFKDLKPGQRVVIDGALAAKAQAAAHVLATRRKWNLVTRKNRQDGTLVVTRLFD